MFLVGFMASGKSSVGQELARRLGWDFVDLDARIEARERKSIPAIFRDQGESGFRLAETAALRDLTSTLARDSVVALGGGAFTQEQNRELLRGWPSVFLESPVDELWRRSSCAASERPLRKSHGQFVRLYQERLPFYRTATATVQTAGREVASICSEIEAALQLARVPDPHPPGSGRTPSAHSQTGESR